jgi:hypothetical protein
MRKLLWPVAAVAVLALELATAAPANAQSRSGTPIRIPSVAVQSINPNPYIAPGLTLRQYAYNTSVMGRALQQVPPYAFGYNPYPSVVNYGPLYAYTPAPYVNPYANPYMSAYANPYLATPSYLSLNPSASPYSP